MPTSSQTDPRHSTRLRALLAALAAAPPHPAYLLWLAPCTLLRSSREARTP
jgi:hypothetical protein